MPKLTLKQNLSHDGKFYGFGSVVELTQKQADELSDILTPADSAAKVSAPQDPNLGASAPAAPAKKEAKADEDGSDDLSSLKRDELMDRLDSAGVAYDPNGTKAQLLETLKASKAAK